MCDGSVFVTACPGSGKTRVLAERARRLFANRPSWHGVAFLSFTKAAIFELSSRLRYDSILPSPMFPSFLGTFDSFVWQFLVAPFGLVGTSARPRLIVDLDRLVVRPFASAHPLPLTCFDFTTHRILPAPAKRKGFDVARKTRAQVQPYETAARQQLTSLRQAGYISFDQARREAILRISDPTSSIRIGAALSGRFQEAMIDETQDCSPEDLEIVSWLRTAGITVTLVCDPEQSIYGFRGGITNHLVSFVNGFELHERKTLNGNFRSTPNICDAVSQLRSLSNRNMPDVSLGPLRGDLTPVYVLAYGGPSVSPYIGRAFTQLLCARGIHIETSPVVAATRLSAAAACGQTRDSRRRDRSVMLAEAVSEFFSTSAIHNRTVVLQRVHELFLGLEGHLSNTTYQQYIDEHDIDAVSWRPTVIQMVQQLRYDKGRFSDARAWHDAAKDLLARQLTISGTRSISQLLRWNATIPAALRVESNDTPTPRTIHSVKGQEFPGICVVTTSSTIGRILGYLEKGRPTEVAEEARKLYVAASRAQRLLAIAVPSSQAARFACHLRSAGANVIEASVRGSV